MHIQPFPSSKSTLTALCLLLLCAAPAFSQAPPDSSLPLVFALGTQEAEHMRVDSLIDQSLFDATNYQIDSAQAVWRAFLESMEDYAREIDYSLGGIEVFLRIYLGPSGEILHLGFWLSEVSRYVPEAELRAFFASFSRNRRFPLTYDRPFKYNAKVRFPLFPMQE